TETIDLYQIHEHRGQAHAGVMDALRDLQREGLIGEVGLSNGTIEGWRAAEAALGARVLSNQVSYSLVDRSAEDSALPYARAQGRVVLAFSPLGQGLLSGKYDGARRPSDPGRRESPLFSPENLDRAADLLATLRAVAETHAATPAQIALAWVIRNPAVAAIPGAATVEQLEHNVAAAEIDLTVEEYEALSAAAAAYRPAH